MNGRQVLHVLEAPSLAVFVSLCISTTLSFAPPTP
jgi:hypothetical protein